MNLGTPPFLQVLGLTFLLILVMWIVIGVAAVRSKKKRTRYKW